MTTEEAIDSIGRYIKWQHESGRYEQGVNPIFEIVLFEHPNKELIYEKDGRPAPSGWPDADLNNMGFYYELDTAVQAMHENWCDIQETCFHAGFILCRFPGLYVSCGPEQRIYFVWDEHRGGFFEADEPDIFKHVAY